MSMSNEQLIKMIVDDLKEVKLDVKHLLAKENERKGVSKLVYVASGLIGAVASLCVSFFR